MTNSKANSKVNLPPTHPPIYEETVRAALRYVAFESDVSVKEIAREISKAEPTTYHKLDDPEQKITLAEFCAITRLAVSKGSNELIDLMLPDNFSVVKLGEPVGETFEAEITELVEDAGRTASDLRAGRHSKAMADANELIQDATAITRRVKGAKK